jgi:hypothetical protein
VCIESCTEDCIVRIVGKCCSECSEDSIECVLKGIVSVVRIV